MSTSSDHLIGLDCWYEISSWGPYRELDPLRRAFQMQVLRVFLSIGLKAMLNGTLDREAARERNRQSILEELHRKLREREAAAPSAQPGTGKTGARGEGREMLRGALGDCAHFRISFDGASVRSQPGDADDDRTVVPGRCGRRDAVAQIGDNLSRIEKRICA